MKRLIAIFLFAFPFISNAQTIKETKDWLTYYLNKYCASDYNYERYKSHMEQLGNMATVYLWKTAEYSFLTDTILQVIEYNHEKDKAGDDKLKSIMTTYLNLARIVKIQVRKREDPIFHNSQATLNFEFSKPEYVNDSDLLARSIIQWDNLKKIYTTEKNAYQLSYPGVISIDEEAWRGDLFDRLKKAFEHHVTLIGGHILKEVF